MTGSHSNHLATQAEISPLKVCVWSCQPTLSTFKNLAVTISLNLNFLAYFCLSCFFLIHYNHPYLSYVEPPPIWNLTAVCLCLTYLIHDIWKITIHFPKWLDTHTHVEVHTNNTIIQRCFNSQVFNSCFCRLLVMWPFVSKRMNMIDFW